MTLKDFLKQHAPLSRWSAPCCEHAREAMKRLDVIYTTNRGSLLSLSRDKRFAKVQLSPSGELRFCFLHSGKIFAKVAPTPRSDVVILSCGLMRLLWVLSVSIWTEPKVTQLIERSGTLNLNPSESEAVPRGFEFLDILDNESDKSLNADFDYLCFSGWYSSSLSLVRADPQLNDACIRTFQTAIQWLMLHESGHVMLGHTSVTAASKLATQALNTFWPAAQFDMEDSNDKEYQLTKHDYCAFELEADVYAAERLLKSVASLNTFVPDSRQRLYTRIAGCLLCPMVFYIYGKLKNSPAQFERHPPLWFRAGIMLKVLDRLISEVPRVNGNSDAASFSYHSAQLMIQCIANLHPAYTEVLSPALNRDHGDPVDFHLQELKSFANEALAMARAKQKTIH